MCVLRCTLPYRFTQFSPVYLVLHLVLYLGHALEASHRVTQFCERCECCSALVVCPALVMPCSLAFYSNHNCPQHGRYCGRKTAMAASSFTAMTLFSTLTSVSGSSRSLALFLSSSLSLSLSLSRPTPIYVSSELVA